MTAQEMLVDVAPVRRVPGMTHPIRGQVVLEGLETTVANVPGGQVEVDLTLKNEVEGVVATGRVKATSQGQCRRCLEPVVEELDVAIREVFELEPTDGETWPIVDDRIDLEPMVHEAVLLALPLVSLCGEDCRGPQPDRFPTLIAVDDQAGSDPPRDPRWSALDQLKFDE